MSVFQSLSLLGLQHVAGYASNAVGAGNLGRDAIASLRSRLADNSTELTDALRKAVERAVTAMGMALEGDSFWNRCKSTLTKGEDRALRDQVRAFLDANPLTVVNRKECLEELKAARKAGIFAGEQRLDLGILTREMERFATFADPATQVNAQWKLVDSLAEGMRSPYPNLAGLLAARPAEGMPLLVVAVRYYFRREVESDESLFRGLSLSRAEEALSAQEAGFDALHRAMNDHGDRLQELLGDIRVVVAQTHDGVLNLQSQVGDLSEAMRTLTRTGAGEAIRVGNRLDGMSEEIRTLTAAMQKFLVREQLDNRPLRPGDSVSYRNDAERNEARKFIAQYRSLPADERQGLPALLNAVGKLGIVAGELTSARQDFQDLAEIVRDNPAKAEAHHNAYTTSLDGRDWVGAFKSFLEAVKFDPERFAPFPFDKYQPVRILGAGGFGVVFLCNHKQMNAPIVVKAIRPEGLTLDSDKVFSEAKLLRKLDHPSVIRITDCGDIGKPGQARRSYLVMDYFEGSTLEEIVKKHGPLAFDDFLGIARQMAEGMTAAHGKNILHRDLKPANVLVKNGPGGWQVKLIDFGLAMQHKVARTGQTTGSVRRTQTVTGGIAGTMDYGAPEQFRQGSDPVGTYSDVFGWAKTCCYALFQTTIPLPKHWSALPTHMVQLLEECLEENPEKRIGSFARVLKRLEGPPTLPPATDPEAYADFATEDTDSPERPAGPTWMRPLALIAGVGIAVLVVVFGILKIIDRTSDQSEKLVGTWVNGKDELEFTSGGTVLTGISKTATYRFDGRRLTITAGFWNPEYVLDLNTDNEMLLSDKDECSGDFGHLKGKWRKIDKPGSSVSPNPGNGASVPKDVQPISPVPSAPGKSASVPTSIRDESAKLIGVWTKDNETLTFTNGKTVVRERRDFSTKIATYEFDGKKLTVSATTPDENTFEVDLTIEEQMLVGKAARLKIDFYGLEGRWKKVSGVAANKSPSEPKRTPSVVIEKSRPDTEESPPPKKNDSPLPATPGPGVAITKKANSEPTIPARKLSPELLKLKPGSFSGRSGPMRAELLSEGGGDERTEEAVALGLTWLAAQQKPDGSWAIEGQTDTTGKTALAVLPFLGAGHTHKRGAHSRVVAKGIEFLLKKQSVEGSSGSQHAMATLAVCEAYVMSGDAALKIPAQKALNAIVAGQSPDGGWKNPPSTSSDTTTSVWNLIALKTGEMAGLKVSAESIQSVWDFLDSVGGPDGGYGSVNKKVAPSPSAAGLLGREYLGWQRDHEMLTKGIELILLNLPPKEGPGISFYYHSSQALRHFGGDEWELLNRRVPEMLLKHQVAAEDKTDPGSVGSWGPMGDDIGKAGGRLMTTSLAVMTLEVYYRHVPLSLSSRPKE